MRGLRRSPGYAALNRPLTVLGVERRAFLLLATLALGPWNATVSLVAVAVVFVVGWGAGRLAGRCDPEILAVLRAVARDPARFDPGKWAERFRHLVIGRERWSLTLRFEFLEAIPRELVVHNPMGLLITCLQADRALVTGEEGR